MAVSVIPSRLQTETGPSCLGPAEILHLAVLGGAARGAVAIDDLMADTQTLGGSFWHPTTDVISACLEALEARQLLTIENYPAPAAAALVRLSVSGIDYLAMLLRRDMGDVPEPLFHCLLAIKIALLDLLSRRDRQRQLEAMIIRLECAAQTIRATKDKHHNQRSHLSNVIDFEENRLRSEIRWLCALRLPEGTVRPTYE